MPPRLGTKGAAPSKDGDTPPRTKECTGTIAIRKTKPETNTWLRRAHRQGSAHAEKQMHGGAAEDQATKEGGHRVGAHRRYQDKESTELRHPRMVKEQPKGGQERQHTDTRRTLTTPPSTAKQPQHCIHPKLTKNGTPKRVTTPGAPQPLDPERIWVFTRQTSWGKEEGKGATWTAPTGRVRRPWASPPSWPA